MACYSSFVQLPSEIALYTVHERSLWKTPATWWYVMKSSLTQLCRTYPTASITRFVVLRYSGILATLPSIFFTAAQTSFCQVAVSVSQVGAVLTVASSGAIFWYRVRALWNGSIVISSIAGVFYLIMIGCWVSRSWLNCCSYPLTNCPRLQPPRSSGQTRVRPPLSCPIASSTPLLYGHHSAMLHP